MALYAFKDEARDIEVLARDAHKENKKVRLYCPNKNCDAHMYICSRSGSSSFYFSATRKEHGHIDGCGHKAGNSFNPDNFNELAFDFNQALSNLTSISTPQTKKLNPGTHKEGMTTSRPPHTIRQIYDMCTQHHYMDTYNNIVIGKMLLYDQSITMYPNDTDVIGWRIVEATIRKGRFYDASKAELYLVAPINKKKYYFVLTFDDKGLYRAMHKEIFANKDNQNFKIIVAGEWSHSTIEDDSMKNPFTTTILSKKQFKII